MYLFFVRHFNDIDHLTPIAWKMHRAGQPVAVYCMNPRYDHQSDYRLHFLKNLGITVDYLHNRFDRHRGLLHELLSRLVEKSCEAQRLSETMRTDVPFYKKRLSYLIGKFGILSYKLIRFGYYDIRWAHSILERSGARAICFDHIMPGLYVVRNLLQAAKEKSIPSFSLPHGVHLYTDEAAKAKSTDARRASKFNEFDHIIVPNRLRKDLLVRSGVSAKKIVVLGSARYSSEWLAQNKKIMPRRIPASANPPSRLKVVFMPSKPQYHADLSRLSTTCNLLAGMKNMDVMIKPHTRTGGEKHLFKDNNLPDASSVLTAELCEWADIALVVGSSVITEVLMQKKPALYLKYLHANTTLFEELGACWTIHDESELEHALRSLQKNKAAVPYGETRVVEYVKQVVYGGRAEKDVLGNYENFITAHAGK
ncbi:MAG: hypothetical protein PVI00_04815 [Desulfobacterales bacterium]|jgi:hypothetical protein